MGSWESAYKKVADICKRRPLSLVIFVFVGFLLLAAIVVLGALAGQAMGWWALMCAGLLFAMVALFIDDALAAMNERNEDAA